MPRPARRPTPKKGADGKFHAWVTIGTKPNGRPHQVHVERSTYDDCQTEIDRLWDDAKKGVKTAPSDRPDFTDWFLDAYLVEIAPQRCGPNTIASYRSLFVHWAVPTLQGTRIDLLQASQFDRMFAAMKKAGKGQSTVLKLYRVMSRSLKVAQRRKLTTENVLEALDAPELLDPMSTPIPTEDAKLLVKAAPRVDSGVRWVLGLLLGVRQGEAIGLRWDDVDFDRCEVNIWWQLQKRSYEHGCGGTCGQRYAPACPKALIPVREGEMRIPGRGLVLCRTKGRSKRTLHLPDGLAALLVDHQARQEVMKRNANNLWTEMDFVFTDAFGMPLNPRTDYQLWQDLLAASGLPKAKVHAMRHTAGSMMLEGGTDTSVVQEILGHRDIRTTRGYILVSSPAARAATEGNARALLG